MQRYATWEVTMSLWGEEDLSGLVEGGNKEM
jgi:hypothetical protein